jgi:chloramphenicol 3-O phosphotransferase
MPNAKVVFLNGASSSGKSSIAKALQSRIETPCIHLCIDDYLSAYQKGLWKKQEVVRREWSNIIRGFHAAGAAIAGAGNMVIMDDVLENDPPWQDSILELFEGIDVFSVGIHCSLSELERREKERQDRRAGMARKQFDQVHSKAIYDIEVDTSLLSSEECADWILAHMQKPRQPTAFAKMRLWR